MVFEKMQEIISDKLGIDEEQVTMSADFKEDLEADSLDLFEIVMELEEEFGLSIPNEDMELIKSVGDAVKYVEDRQ